MTNKRPVVGFFGTWRVTTENPLYKFASTCGQYAAQNGMDILTGGYTGIMEAPLAGAKECDSQAALVGYTWTGLDGILSPSSHLTSTLPFGSICHRAASLVEDSDLCVFFPGRTGTVAELALAMERWSKGQMESPILLATNYWVSFFDWLKVTNEKLEFSADEPVGSLPYRIVNSPEEFRDFIKYEYTRP